MSNLADKVQAGIKLLNSEKPGWQDLVDLGKLDLGSCAVCVLGQVFGDYSEGLEELGLSGGRQYGFDGPSDEMRELTDAWVEALGKSNVLVEKDDVYRDKYGYAVKVLQTHLLEVDGEKFSTYVVLNGTVNTSTGTFTSHGSGQDLVLLRKPEFETGGAYPIKVEKFQVKRGMFLVNDAGETFYAIADNEVRPIKDGAFAVYLNTIDQKGLREMTLPGGKAFSATLVK